MVLFTVGVIPEQVDVQRPTGFQVTLRWEMMVHPFLLCESLKLLRPTVWSASPIYDGFESIETAQLVDLSR